MTALRLFEKFPFFGVFQVVFCEELLYFSRSQVGQIFDFPYLLVFDFPYMLVFEIFARFLHFYALLNGQAGYNPLQSGHHPAIQPVFSCR